MSVEEGEEKQRRYMVVERRGGGSIKKEAHKVVCGKSADEKRRKY